jgi:hypothetical protein
MRTRQEGNKGPAYSLVDDVVRFLRTINSKAFLYFDHLYNQNNMDRNRRTASQDFPAKTVCPPCLRANKAQLLGVEEQVLIIDFVWLRRKIGNDTPRFANPPGCCFAAQAMSRRRHVLTSWIWDLTATIISRGSTKGSGKFQLQERG